MKLTIEKLEKLGACEEGKNWFLGQKETNGIKIVQTLCDVNLNWANWIVVRLMTHKQNVRYAIFAAEQVIGLYEKKYPDDARPRKAINAAKAYLKNPSAKTKKNAAYAANAANAAANAAYAAADAAANAAAYAANAANAAANAAYAAYAAANAANAAAEAADAANAEMKKRIVLNGVKILKEVKK